MYEMKWSILKTGYSYATIDALPFRTNHSIYNCEEYIKARELKLDKNLLTKCQVFHPQRKAEGFFFKASSFFDEWFKTHANFSKCKG